MERAEQKRQRTGALQKISVVRIRQVYLAVNSTGGDQWLQVPVESFTLARAR